MVGKLTPDTIVSGSVVPALLAANPYKSPNDVMAAILDAREGKQAEPWAGNEQTLWGDLLEPLVAAQAVDRLGLTGLTLSPNYPFNHVKLPLACSIDALAKAPQRTTISTDADAGVFVMTPSGSITVSGWAVLEIKTTQAQPEGADGPAAYRGPIQLQAQLMCCDQASWGVVAVLYRGSNLQLFVYGPDADVQKSIEEAVLDLEKRLDGPDWYAPISSADADKTWGRGEADLPPVILGDESADLIDAIVDAKATIKSCEGVIDQAEAALKEILGNHVEGHHRDYVIKWPMRHYKASPAKTVAAKPERWVRQSTLTIAVRGDAA